MMPTRMNPMTGVISSRAKAGMTIPAAPRMVSVSLSPVLLLTPGTAMLALVPVSPRPRKG